MTWLEMANLLFEKSESLSPRGAHLHLDTAGWLRTWTPHQNRAADNAAEYFALHREWPEMEQEPACQLYFRCLFVIESCIERHANGPKPPTTPEREVETLRGLLVDHWHLEGIEWAQRRYTYRVHKPSRVFA
jgi:hypothetical protein